MFRRCSLSLAVALLGVGIQAASANVTLNFGINSIVGETSVDTTLSGFSIRIGRFQTITPTLANYGLWSADFADLTGITLGLLVADGTAFVTPPAGEFGPFLANGDASETYNTAYSAGLNPGDQISVWIFNSTVPGVSTQAILLTQSSWILPAIPGTPSSATFGWINGQAGAGALTIVGGVGQVANNSYVDSFSEPGVRLKTTNVLVPEPSSMILLGFAGVGLLARWRRVSRLS